MVNTSNPDFELFRKHPTWQGLPDSFWEFCRTHGRVRRYGVKQFLFFSGDEGTHVYFLLKGRLRILLMSEFTEKIFRILQPPAFFPEVILDSKVYPYAVLTAEASEVLILERKLLLQCLKENPSYLFPFYQSMALDLRRAYRQIKNIALGDARSRLGAKIFALAHVHGKKTPQGIVITVPLSATDLAGMCSLARESVSRILSELKESEIITMNKKEITVNDLETLRKWINEHQASL